MLINDLLEREMDLARASHYHQNVCVDGWDRQAGVWHMRIAKVNFKRQDSFIVNRSFGLTKRIITAHPSQRIPSDYRVLRFQDDEQRYIVESENQNKGKLNRVYQYAYQLRRAPHTAEIIELQTEETASGMPGNTVSVVVGTEFCGLDAFGAATSADFDAVVYDKITVVLPGNVPLTTDNLLRINDLEYDVHQVTPNVLETLAICTVRGRG